MGSRRPAGVVRALRFGSGANQPPRERIQQGHSRSDHAHGAGVSASDQPHDSHHRAKEANPMKRLIPVVAIATLALGAAPALAQAPRERPPLPGMPKDFTLAAVRS